MFMNLTLSIDDDVIREASRRAEALGTSVNQLVREYLEQLAGKSDPNEDAAEFERLSRLAQGNSRGWKFNREELHRRKQRGGLKRDQNRAGRFLDGDREERRSWWGRRRKGWDGSARCQRRCSQE